MVAATSKTIRLGNGIPAPSIKKAKKTMGNRCSSRKSKLA